MTGHIFIYNYIGTEEGEVSINNVREQINQYPKASDFIVHIVSGGGDVFEGYGIYNIIKNLNKPIETRIEGLCASIATLIAFAGDKIIMNKTSEFMIHNPYIDGIKGDAGDLRNVANQLDTIKNLLIDVSGRRAARNGKSISKEQLWALYDNETWLTADQAATQYGFADEVVESMKAVAKVDITKIKNDMEKSLFDQLSAKITNLFKALKIKNQTEDTLADGRKVMIMDNNGDLTNAQIMLETGEPLPDGEYDLASGSTITVVGSVITAVVPSPEPADTTQKGEPNTQDMEKDARIKELEAQLAAALATSQASAKAAETAEVTNKSIMAKVEILEKQFKDLSEAAAKTFGDDDPIEKDHAFRNAENGGRQYDAMSEELGNAWLTSRPANFKNKE